MLRRAILVAVMLGTVFAASVRTQTGPSANDARKQEAQQNAAPAQASKETTAAHPPRVRMPGSVVAATLVHRVEPAYPADTRVVGTVVLHAVIGTSGAVQKLDYMSGPPFLASAAIEAARQWRYKPQTIRGEAVEVDTTISVDFHWRDKN